jgi:site-specific DNA recombinase
VLSALQTHLMRDDLIEVFCQEYTNHLNALRAERDQARKARMAEKMRLEKKLENLVTAIGDGVDLRMIKGPLERTSARLEELEAETALDQDRGPPKPLVHPAMAKRYRREVENLRKALGRKDARAEAAEHLRGLIGKIVLTPEPGREELRIDLHGDLAGILQIASLKQARPGQTLDWSASGPNKMALVAGAGFGTLSVVFDLAA